MSHKLAALFLLVLLAFVCLAGTITYINAKSGEKYKKTVMSQAQARYESRVLPARRGDIYDRNGNVLATSNKVYNVILDCLVVNSNSKYLDPTVEALSTVLGLDEGEMRSKLTNEATKESQYQVVKRNISMEEKKTWDAYLNAAYMAVAAQNQEEEEESEGEEVQGEDNTQEEEESQVKYTGTTLSNEEIRNRLNVQGVWFEEDYLRLYPYNEAACDAIGFTYSRDTAYTGLEGYYNSLLSGVDGRIYGYFNANSDVEQTIIPATNGSSIETSLDVGAQQIVEKYVTAYNQATGGAHVGVVVANPNTGEIIAMDGGDRYDLNHPRDLSLMYSPEQIKAMTDEQTVAALNAIWGNYTVSEAFEPGSVVKPIVMAAALEKGKITTGDNFVCDGYQVFGAAGDVMIRCAVYPDAHGTEDLSAIIANSCNDGMMQIADKMGVEQFVKTQTMFNFGSRTGIDLPNEGYGMIHTTASMGETELACSSFGQGFTCTMIQEVAALASVINGGYYYQPHLVTGIRDTGGTLIKSYAPILLKQTVSSTISKNVREYMEKVVTEGTGTHARLVGYSLGGKTGTAEKIPRGNGKYLVSFVGFAPVSSPEVIIYVVVDEPNVEDQSTSIF
ncbi:MAG: cell division protein FtsI, partial [Blautia sp.]|nr:cell division protein FtsI [Blautia sp.]